MGWGLGYGEFMCRWRTDNYRRVGSAGDPLTKNRMNDRDGVRL